MLTVQRIQQEVADYYGLKINDMSSGRRFRPIARPRQVAMYICRRLTPFSLIKIGYGFGGKDHTTIMHAIKTIEKMVLSDENMKCDIEQITKKLEV